MWIPWTFPEHAGLLKVTCIVNEQVQFGFSLEKCLGKVTHRLKTGQVQMHKQYSCVTTLLQRDRYLQCYIVHHQNHEVDNQNNTQYHYSSDIICSCLSFLLASAGQNNSGPSFGQFQCCCLPNASISPCGTSVW